MILFENDNYFDIKSNKNYAYYLGLQIKIGLHVFF